MNQLLEIKYYVHSFSASKTEFIILYPVKMKV